MSRADLGQLVGVEGGRFISKLRKARIKLRLRLLPLDYQTPSNLQPRAAYNGEHGEAGTGEHVAGQCGAGGQTAEVEVTAVRNASPLPEATPASSAASQEETRKSALP